MYVFFRTVNPVKATLTYTAIMKMSASDPSLLNEFTTHAGIVVGGHSTIAGYLTSGVSMYGFRPKIF